jgi:hypothetical protein
MAEEHLQNNAIGAAVGGGEAEAKAEEYEVTAQYRQGRARGA